VFWYLLQIATIWWMLEFLTSLHTNASVFAMYLLALFVAYVLTLILSMVLDLLRRTLWWLGNFPLRAYTLLSQQPRNNLGVHVAKHVLPGRTPEKRRTR
jgi:apolipoprotein N-acyltransferase